MTRTVVAEFAPIFDGVTDAIDGAVATADDGAQIVRSAAAVVIAAAVWKSVRMAARLHSGEAGISPSGSGIPGILRVGTVPGSRRLLDVAAGDAHATVSIDAIEVPESGAAGIAFESHGHVAILA